MASARSTIQTIAAGSPKQAQPYIEMLDRHIYDTSSVGERLFCTTTTTINEAESADKVASVPIIQKALEDQILEFDSVMGTSPIRSRL
ncbi:hypothetical protein NW768_008803 [Fusarium equiseti]|uniref:Uncharacterized protein n=1 Tax=Fusarium equiseti TaxID=61235 RepID=A0ABQ8R5B2_FUSEQ|nr:hypothetical protein NW768_008803 [Fusarium equiseti]